MPALNVNGRAVSCAITGGGEPVLVLVHGAGGSHAEAPDAVTAAIRAFLADLP